MIQRSVSTIREYSLYLGVLLVIISLAFPSTKTVCLGGLIVLALIVATHMVRAFLRDHDHYHHDH